MPHRLLFLDFETYYGDDYTLKKQTPPEYILDPRFECIGCSVREDTAGTTGVSRFIDGPAFGEFLSGYDPRDTTTVTFNALFDNCILAWRYGFVPARMVCTMRMAVALRGHLLPSYSLGSVGKLLGVGSKGTTIENVRGMRRADIIAAPANLWQRFQDYANNDNEMNAAIFYKLLPELPPSERKVMDRVLRCAVDPAFVIDTVMLREHLEQLKEDKRELLRTASGAPPSDGTAVLDLGDNDQIEAGLRAFVGELRSADKFKQLLEARGVDIEYKTSPSDPTRSIPAFAKTDEFMADLQEHDDPIVQALASARLGVRSTIEETRGARMLAIAGLGETEFYRGSKFPIPLRYAGAHTHRLSGDWKINMQNLPSGRGTAITKLRKALVAPEGNKAVAGDLAQIEARVCAWICGQLDLLDQFANDLDPYSILASDVFGFTVDKKIHLIERFIGKGGVLGCGFGCGHAKLYNMVVRDARKMGMDMPTLLAIWTPDLAERTVSAYRTRHSAIKNTWYKLDRILQSAWCGLSGPVRFGPCVIGHGYVEGPNNLKMVYQVISTDKTDLRYIYGKRSFHMYGAKFLENIVQFLARIIVMNAALRLWDRGYKFKLQSHDELVFIVPDDQVEACKVTVMEELCRRPSWARDLPLKAEVGHGQTYGDAK
jgi:DNA polymerase family A